MKKVHYQNEVDKPSQPAQGHMSRGMGVSEYKSGFHDAAYGAATKSGIKSDYAKLRAQKDMCYGDGY